ncbi:MAG: T9SS type A sorting domain-containing protein [Lacibacter sp.]
MAKTLLRTLSAVTILFFITTGKLFAQFPSWPFPNLVKPVCSTMPSAPSPVTVPSNNTCTKWPVVNNGAWHNPATWNDGTLPRNMDIVCIPEGVTVQVTNPTYSATSICPVPAADTNNTPRLFIFICGTLDFKAGGKLHLGCLSTIQIYAPTGRILAAQGNSDLIRIGTKEVWGKDNIDINGPYYFSDGCGTNPLGCQGAGVLPVEFGAFTIRQRGPRQVDLEWFTFTEINALHFVAERSQDGTNWQQIGTVAAKGQSPSKVTYRFSDMQAPAGTVFYRLRQVDADGRFFFSDVLRIAITPLSNIQLYPNPVANVATLYAANGFKSNQSIQIFGVRGNLVQTVAGRTGNTISIPVEQLRPGIYTIRVVDNGLLVSQMRMLKQ